MYVIGRDFREIYEKDPTIQMLLCLLTGTIFQISPTLHGHFKKLTHD